MRPGERPTGQPARSRRERAAAPSRPDPDAPVVTGFEVGPVLGHGARTTVHRISGPDGRSYALKILDHLPEDDAQAATTFRREAALVAAIGHPALPRVHEVGNADGRPYLIMDLVEGSRLSQVLQAGPLSPAGTLTLALELIDALGALHRQGLVHRDVKPQNVMITPDGAARLIDFGLAVRHGLTPDGGTGDGGTGEEAVGTLAYAAPEQTGMLRRPVDARADLYALGVVLFECLSGSPPFSTDDVGELLRMHAVVPAPDLRDLVPGLPHGLADVVATLLAKDPDDRYSGTGDLAARLRLLQAPAPAPTPARLPLTAREHELAWLGDAWRAAVAGRGGVVMLHGPGGIGKTRLAQELADGVASRGYALLAARCTDDDTRPLAPLRRALEGFVLARDTGATDPAQRQRLVADAAGPAAPALAGLSPTLAAVLRQPHGATGVESQDQLANVVAGFLIDLAGASGGLLLHLDDVQWMDGVSRRVLARLAAELDRKPLLVLCTSRDDPDAAASTAGLVDALGDSTTEISLGPLNPAGLAALLAAALPGVLLDERTAALLAARGEGSPFLALQYVHAVLDAGLLVPHWGSWRLDEAALAALALPQDVLGLVLARVGKLGPDSRGPLVAAAALGTRFHPETVAAVTGRPVTAVLGVLDEAASYGLVEPVDSGRYTFVHDRIREALTGTDPDAAAELHHRIAEALVAQDVPGTGADTERLLAIARHTLLSGDAADPARTRQVCEAAALAALAEHDPSSAVTLLRAADEALPTASASVVLALGVALTRDGRLEQADVELSRALDLTDDPLRRAEVLATLAHCQRSRWHSDDAARTVAAGLAELDAALPAGRLPRTLSTLARFVRGNAPQWLRGLHASRRAAGRADAAELERLHLLVALYSIGCYLGLTAMAPVRMLMHVVHARFWADRIGSGTAYVKAHALFGFCIGGGGLHRLADRTFVRAQAAAVGQAPAVVAELEHFRGATAYFGGADDGELWRDAIRHYGRWMETWSFSDGLASMVMDATMLGRTDLAGEWQELARRRLGAEASETTWFTVGPAMLAAASGQEWKAAQEGRDLAALTPGHAAMHALVRAFAAWEAGPRSGRLDAAVEEFDALGLKPAMLIRGTRYILAAQAMARLARCRTVPDADRAVELAQARIAVRRLARVASTASMRGYLAVARADLDLLRGRPQRARRRLDRLDRAPGPDAPRLAYEAARVRARELAAHGLGHAAHRQVLLARAVAQEQGWPHRLAWLDDEFGAADDRTAESIGACTITGGRTRAHGTGGAQGAGSARAQVDRRRLQAVQEVGAAASKVLDPRALARIALGELTRILAADRALLFLVGGGEDSPDTDGSPDDGPRRADDDGGPLQPYVGSDATGAGLACFTDYSASLVERVRTTREPLVVTGTEEGAALGAQSVVLHGLRSILIAPLLLDHRLLGVVYLDSRVVTGIFTADDLSILTAVTAYIAASLETARAAALELSVQGARHQRDLAEQARELERQQAQASRLESIGRLAAGIAHEINTPLQFVTDNTRFLVDATSTLLARAQAMPRGDDADVDFLAEEIPNALRESLDGLGRVTEIVRAMKDYAHPGTERGETDLNRALRMTGEVCRNEWKHVAVLELDLDPAAGLVSCYEGEVKQVVLNMLVNAAQAITEFRRTHPDAPFGRILVSSRRTAQEFLITVSDNGIGMDEHVRRHAFDPFFTTKEVGRGTGQGLALAHTTVVTKHHGRLEVDSTPGQGSTFTIALPLRRGRPAGP